jgi:two-component system sensor histidine kinase DesK
LLDAVCAACRSKCDPRRFFTALASCLSIELTHEDHIRVSQRAKRSASAMTSLRLRLFNSVRGRWYPDDPDTGDLPVLLLMYLGFLLLPLAMPRFAVLPVWPTLLALLLFLPLYFWGWWRPPQLPLLAISIALIGFALTPSNPGASTFVVYALAQSAEVRSLKWALVLLGGIVTSYGVLLWWIEFPAVVMLAAVIPGLAVFFGNRSFREMHKRRAMLRMTQEEVRRLGERAERERIARDLHDLLGHTLSLIALKAELARKLAIRAPERAADEMAQVEQLARSSLDEVRLALHDMRRATLEQEVAQLRLTMEAADIPLELHISEVALELACESALAYALREACTNIIRHAHATRAQVNLHSEGDYVRLEISDNGRGGVSESGNGLRGMRERIHACGGKLQVSAARGQGCRLSIAVPRLKTTSSIGVPTWRSITESAS